eukprot:10714755-Alexandrium_andersonii.AAC.1
MSASLVGSEMCIRDSVRDCKRAPPSALMCTCAHERKRARVREQVPVHARMPTRSRMPVRALEHTP